MDLRSLCPLRASSLVWQPSRGRHSMLVVCKATYDLAPITSELAEPQDAINEDDKHWDADPRKSLYSPSDMVPVKARADVVLVGSAFAPRGQPVSSLTTRLIVAEVDKAIEVVCDRAITREGALREGARFTQMPLRYERAAASAESPVGMRAGAADAYGQVGLPNLVPPGFTVGGASDVVPHIGFGPIARGPRASGERPGQPQAAWVGRSLEPAAAAGRDGSLVV